MKKSTALIFLRCWILFLFLIHYSSSFAQEPILITPTDGILYVDYTKNGVGNNWANAVGDLSDAMNAVKFYNDTSTTKITQIWVAKGTYEAKHNAQDNSVGNAGSYNSFVLLKDVKIYGGFAGGETNISERDIESLLTGTILNGNGTLHHVVISAGNVGLACLDGFSITGGKSQNTPGASMSVNNETIKEGYGAGLIIVNSAPIIKNININNNAAAGYGGGIHILNANGVQLENINVFENTAGGGGGGIFIQNSSLTYKIGRIQFNSTSGDGGGLANNQNCAAVYENIVVKNNSANGFGGGVYNNANSSNKGPTFKNMQIMQNRSSFYGGGVYANVSYDRFINTLIANNTADVNGAGLYVQSQPGYIMTNVTVVGNTCKSPTGASGLYDGTIGSIQIMNSIIWGNYGGSSMTGNSLRPNCQNSLIQGFSLGGNNLDGTSITDILLADTANQNYRPTENSPFIDKGSNKFLTDLGLDISTAVDLDGDLRVANGVVDLGAYEFYERAIGLVSDTIIYVDSSSTSGGDGSSWANAMNEFADALNKAHEIISSSQADTVEIWVAKGTYKPKYDASNTTGNTSGGKNDAFVLEKNVRIYGGFKGDEEERYQRNWRVNSTILDGTGYYHTIISAGDVGVAYLSGFTIKGGGVYESVLNQITVNGETILNNRGANIYLSNSSPQLVNLIVKDNDASFIQVGYGGGIYAYQSNSDIVNVQLINNVALNGGGVYDSLSNMTYVNLLTSGNSSTNRGGGAYFDESSSRMINVIIAGNSANEGSGVYSSNSTSSFLNTIIWSNNVAGTSSNTYEYSLVEGVNSNGTGCIDGTNPANAPLFKDSINGDYSVFGNSITVNAGSNVYYENTDQISLDLNGDSRFYRGQEGGIIDMGSYEYQGRETTITISDKTVPYDGKKHTVDSVFLMESGVPIGEKSWITYEYYKTNSKLDTLPVAGGVYTVVGYFDGNENWMRSRKDTAVLKIEKLMQAITFDIQDTMDINSSPSTVQLQAKASSGLPVRYRVNPNTAAKVTANGALTLLDTGKVTVTAYQNGNDAYDTAPSVSKDLQIIASIIRSPQIITFNELDYLVISEADIPDTINLKDSVMVSSGLPAVFELTGTGATITSDGLLIITEAKENTLIITVTQDGNEMYEAATPVSQILHETKASGFLDQIYFGTLDTIDMNRGSLEFSLTATTEYSKEVSYILTSGEAVTVTKEGLVRVKSIGNVVITAYLDTTQGWATPVSRELVIVAIDTLIAQSIVFTKLDTIDKNHDPLTFQLQSTASSGLPVTYRVTSGFSATVNSYGIVDVVDTGTVQITAYQDGNGIYDAANPVTQQLVIIAKDLLKKQNITFPRLRIIDIYTDSLHFILNATASSNLPIRYKRNFGSSISVDSTGIVDIITTGISMVAAYQDGNEEYEAASPVNEFIIVVSREPDIHDDQVITFNSLDTVNMFKDELQFQLTASSNYNLPVKFTLTSGNAATVTEDGFVKIQNTGRITIAATQEGNDTILEAQPVIQELIVIARDDKPQVITFRSLDTIDMENGPLSFNLTASSSSGLAVMYRVISGNAAVVTSAGLVTVMQKGKVVIEAYQNGNNEYIAATSVSQDLVILDRLTQNITFELADTLDMNHNPLVFVLNASASSGLPVKYRLTANDPENIAIVSSSGNVKILNTGKITITAYQDGNETYKAAAPISQQLVITAEDTLRSQTITFDLLEVVDISSISTLQLVATASSGLPVKFRLLSGSAATVTESGLVTLLNTGVVAITAYQNGDAEYDSAKTVTQPLVLVDKSAGLEPQNIIFNSIDTIEIGESSLEFVLLARASSNLPVKYIITSGVAATVDSLTGLVKVKSVGSVIITAYQEGNNIYEAAEPVSQNLVIVESDVRRAQDITFTSIDTVDVNIGPLGFVLNAVASSGLPVRFKITSSTPDSIAIVSSNGNVKVLAAGKVIITAYQDGDSNYEAASPVNQQLIIVDKDRRKSQEIIFGMLDIVDINTISSFQLIGRATSRLPVRYKVTYGSAAMVTESGLITIVSEGVVVVSAYQDGNAEYRPAMPVGRLLGVVDKSKKLNSQTIDFPPLDTVDLSTDILEFNLSATASSGLPVKYFRTSGTAASVDSMGLVKVKSVGTIVISAYQEGNNVYEAAPIVEQKLVVRQTGIKQSQDITFTPIPKVDISKDTLEFMLSATASSGLPVRYMVNSGTVAAVTNDGLVDVLSVGTEVITAYQDGNDEYEAALPISRILKVVGLEDMLIEIDINGEVWDLSKHYVIGCDFQDTIIEIKIQTIPNAIVDKGSLFTVDINDFTSMKEVDFTITSSGGTRQEHYTLILEKTLRFEDIVVQRWNNTLIVNNNPATNGSYIFTDYTWYRNGIEIGQKQYYSAGENVTDILDESASYSVRLTTQDGRVIQTCEGHVVLQNLIGKAYPNPVRKGEEVYVNVAMDEHNIRNGRIEVYNLMGTKLSEHNVESSITVVKLPPMDGLYVIRYCIGDFKREFFVVVK